MDEKQKARRLRTIAEQRDAAAIALGITPSQGRQFGERLRPFGLFTSPGYGSSSGWIVPQFMANFLLAAGAGRTSDGQLAPIESPTYVREWLRLVPDRTERVERAIENIAPGKAVRTVESAVVISPAESPEAHAHLEGVR